MERIEDFDAVRAAGVGYIVDPFNRRWHRPNCGRVAGMTTGEPKWLGRTRADVDVFLAQRMARYSTARPITPCPTCRPDAGGDPTVEEASTSTSAKPAVLLDVVHSDRGFAVITPHRVTFGPRAGSPASQVRATLCELLPRVRPREGEILHAVLRGRIPVNSDVENQLIYNVFDGPSAAALSRGVRFELDDLAATDGFDYRYGCATAGAAFTHWRPADDAASWSGVPIAPGPPELLLSRTWAGLHVAPVAVFEPVAAGSRFGLRLCVRAPVRLTPERLKQVVDGVVCAFQRHVAGESAIRRIAAALRQDPSAVTAALDARARAVLGSAEHPVKLTRESVQWNPDDTRLVAAEVRVTPGTEWQLAGSVFAVERR